MVLPYGMEGLYNFRKDIVETSMVIENIEEMRILKNLNVIISLKCVIQAETTYL